MPELVRPPAAGKHARTVGIVYDEIGRIVLYRISTHGIAPDLWETLRLAVDRLRLSVRLVVEENGRAVILDRISGSDGAWQPVSTDCPEALRLAVYLRRLGFQSDDEPGKPQFRLGPPHTELNGTRHDHSESLYLALPAESFVADEVPAEPAWGGSR